MRNSPALWLPEDEPAQNKVLRREVLTQWQFRRVGGLPPDVFKVVVDIHRCRCCGGGVVVPMVVVGGRGGRCGGSSGARIGSSRRTGGTSRARGVATSSGRASACAACLRYEDHH